MITFKKVQEIRTGVQGAGTSTSVFRVRRTLISTCFYLFLFTLAARGQTALPEYQQTATINNPEVQAAYRTYQAAISRARQLGYLPDPRLEIGYFILPVETRVGEQQLRLALMQAFPWFGTLGTAEEVGLKEARAALAAYEAAVNRLKFEVAQHYYRLYSLDEKARIAEEHLEVLQQFEELATTRAGTGQGRLVDVLRVQMQQRELRTRLAELRDNWEAQQTAFNLLLNRPPDAEVVLPDTLGAVELTLNNLADSVVANPLVAQVLARQEAAQERLTLVRKQNLPQFSLGATYIQVQPYETLSPMENGQDVLMPMASVSIPLWRGRYRNAREEVELTLESLELQQQEVVNDLVARLETALASFRTAEREVQLYQEQTETARTALQLLLTAYATAEEDFEEILRIERELLNYEQELIQAVVEQNIAEEEVQMIVNGN